MYIKKLIYENVGPIEQVVITPSFTPEGNPKPVILVGENGTGKSTILSNIVDSFYEMARKAYNNVCETEGGMDISFIKQFFEAIYMWERE